MDSLEFPVLETMAQSEEKSHHKNGSAPSSSNVDQLSPLQHDSFYGSRGGSQSHIPRGRSHSHYSHARSRSHRAASIHSRYGSQLGDSQVDQLKIAFNLFDKDHNGQITASELQTVLKTLGQNVTKEETEEMMATVDMNKDGNLEFTEFVTMMENRIFLPSNTTEYQDAFKFFDKNGDGTIDFNELKDVLLSLGEDFKDSDIQDMIDEADMTGSGTVDFLEFIKMMPSNIQDNYELCVDREAKAGNRVDNNDSVLHEAHEPQESGLSPEPESQTQTGTVNRQESTITGTDIPTLQEHDTAIIYSEESR